MKIFIPEKKDPNPYLDEIATYSSQEFIFDDFRNYKPEYPIVNIHWPEAIFYWRQPTAKDLDVLEKEIKIWKKHSKIVYTYHDESSHFYVTENHSRLFKIIENNADCFIHLGENSKIRMGIDYPNAHHTVIPHPLYINSYKYINKAEARRKLKIDTKALVILAPGRIRKQKEREMLLTAFQSIPRKNKVLISNNMFPFIIKKNFRGKNVLKKIIDVDKLINHRFFLKYRPPKYIFHFGFTDADTLSNMVSAADLIFIPRIDILNSGNIFLGLSYRKIVVGPGIGNIQEILSEFNFPVFNPHSETSIKSALQSGLKLFEEKLETIDERKLLKYHPRQIAKEMDEWFNNLEN